MLALVFSVQNLMAPNLTAIARDFGFNDEERDRKLGGEIAVGFFIVGAPIALLSGYLADLTKRKIFLVIIIFLGEIPTLLTVFVTEYWHLMVLRIFVGISIGGAPPLILSLIGDMYPSQDRMRILAYYYAVAMLGVALGQLMSGMVGPALGWRVPFLIVAIPGILLNLLVLFTLAEPKRGFADLEREEHFRRKNGGQEGGGGAGDGDDAGPGEYQYEQRITPGKFCGIFTLKSNLVLILQGIPGCLPWAASIVFLNDYLAQEKGLTVFESTIIMSAWNLGSLSLSRPPPLLNPSCSLISCFSLCHAHLRVSRPCLPVHKPHTHAHPSPSVSLSVSVSCLSPFLFLAPRDFTCPFVRADFSRVGCT